MIGLIFQSVTTFMSMLFVISLAQRAAARQEERHRLEMERLAAVIRKRLPAGDSSGCSVEACSGKTPEQCALYGEKTNEVAQPLPIARALKL